MASAWPTSARRYSAQASILPRARYSGAAPYRRSRRTISSSRPQITAASSSLRRDGALIHVADVADVSIGPENAYVGAFPNGKPGLGIIILRQPGANIVRIADAVQAALPRLTAALPASVEVSVLNDRTRTIRSSLHEVELTLVLTLALVVIVMGLFLRQISATLIVGAVLGVAVISTFAAMYLLGFSLNNLTLVALVIAVGFVVDDAIVVVENIHRHIEMGKSAVDAAIAGAREIGFTVVSITFSLIAAFIPLLFMGGIIGRLFREFSLTVTVSLLISMVAALTLAPMLCARFMKPLPHRADTAKFPPRDRPADRGLWPGARMDAGAPAAHAARFCSNDRRNGCELCPDPEGLLPASGHRFRDGHDAGGGGYLPTRICAPSTKRSRRSSPGIRRFSNIITRSAPPAAASRSPTAASGSCSRIVATATSRPRK